MNLTLELDHELTDALLDGLTDSAVTAIRRRGYALSPLWVRGELIRQLAGDPAASAPGCEVAHFLRKAGFTR